jgi:hypothetical protein
MLSGTLSGPGGGNSVINYPGAVGGTGLLNEGPLTVYGTLVAGNGLTRSSAGATLTIGNNVTLGDGSQFEVNLNDPSDKIDLLAINGSLTLDALSTLDVNLVNGSMISGSTYTVATFTPGDLTGEFGTVAFVGGSYGSYDIVYNNAAGVIDLQVASNNPEGESVPEPGVWAMMLGGFTIPGLLRFRRNA